MKLSESEPTFTCVVLLYQSMMYDICEPSEKENELTIPLKSRNKKALKDIFPISSLHFT